MNPIRIGLLGGSSLVGFFLSTYLSQHFYALRSGTAAFRSACNWGEGANCDVVALSRYAELFPNFPLSSLAAGWFVVAAILTTYAATQPFRRKEAIRALFVWSIAGTFASGAYFFVMTSVIGTLCFFCLGIDVMILTILGTTLSLRPESFRKVPLKVETWRSFAIPCLVGLLLPVGGFRLMADPAPSDAQMQQIADSILASPVLSISKGRPELSMGPENAKITIVEFSDFQCPFCKRGAMLLNTLKNSYPKDIRIEFRSFPLDSKCNRGGGMHPFACEAAKVNRCAAQQKLFPQVYETLFENQEKIRSGLPRQWALEAGADATALDACVGSGETASAIEVDVEEGIVLSVQSTPTFFINGHRVEGAYPIPVWEKVISGLMK